MISRTESDELVRAYLKRNYPDHEMAIVDVIERPYGWAYEYQTRSSVESGDINDAIVGNPPLLVLREDGKFVSLVGTFDTTEVSLRKYEESRLR